MYLDKLEILYSSDLRFMVAIDIGKKIKNYMLNNRENFKKYISSESKIDISILKDSDIGIYLRISSDLKMCLLQFNRKRNIEVDMIKGQILTPYIKIDNHKGRGGIVELYNTSFDSLIIEYGFVFSGKMFDDFLSNPIRSIEDIIYSKIELKNNDKLDIDEYLKRVNEFEKLVLNNEKELILDKYLEENIFILEYSLQLINFQHQVCLKDINSLFNQDLRPDVIAFKPLENKWHIVDYKRSKIHMLNNKNKARIGLGASVNSLISQLRGYIKYFEQINAQKLIKEKYNMNIYRPKGIGIIGTIDNEDKNDFIEALEMIPKNIDIFTYDNIIKECRRQLYVMKEVSKSER